MPGLGSMAAPPQNRVAIPSAQPAPPSIGIGLSGRAPIQPQMPAPGGTQPTIRPGLVGTAAGGQYRVFDGNDTEGMHAAGWANPFAPGGDKDFYKTIKARWGVK